jgi:hypothetical protein
VRRVEVVEGAVGHESALSTLWAPRVVCTFIANGGRAGASAAAAPGRRAM